MKTRQVIVVLVTAVGVLGVGLVALATDFDWNCTGLCTAEWTQNSNWLPSSGYPSSTSDSATIDATASACIFDSTTPVIIQGLTLEGDSPTKRTLFVKDAELSVVDPFNLKDYGRVDADGDFTVTRNTFLFDDGWIDVADDTTVSLATANVAALVAHLHLTITQTNSVCQATFLRIAANSAGEKRTFKFTGGDMEVTDTLLVLSDLAPGSTNRAKLWVIRGSITADKVDAQGGDTVLGSAQFDIDDTLTVTTETDLDGRVNVSVASGKTFDTGLLRCNAGTILAKKGSGTLQSS